MKKLIVCSVVLFSVFVYPLPMPYAFDLFEDQVKMSDLAQLSDEGIQTLKQTEFDVFLAQIAHTRAELKVESAEAALKEAKTSLEKELLNIRAAKAEIKAAEAHQDSQRKHDAEKVLKEAEKTVEISEVFHQWKQKELKICQTEEKMKKILLHSAKAKRELARISMLAAEKLPFAHNYSTEDYEKRVKKIQKEYKDRSETEEKLRLEAQQLKMRFDERAAGKGK